MQILHVDASPKTESSVSRFLANHLLSSLDASSHVKQTVTHDLRALDLYEVDDDFIEGLRRGTTGARLDKIRSKSDALVDDLLACDLLLISTPMHNFSVPAKLKLWIDHIARAGRTFKYSESGPKGLLEGKRAIIVVSTGGIYSSGPGQKRNHLGPYLTSFLNFLGITEVSVVYSEGLDISEELRARGIDNAKAELDDITSHLGQDHQSVAANESENVQ